MLGYYLCVLPQLNYKKKRIMYIVFTHASGDIYSAILVDYMHVMSRTYCNQPVFINNTLVVVLSVLHIIYDISWKGIPMVTLLVVYPLLRGIAYICFNAQLRFRRVHRRHQALFTVYALRHGIYITRHTCHTRLLLLCCVSHYDVREGIYITYWKGVLTHTTITGHT